MTVDTPTQTVLAALRRTRDEAQLTQILAAFAASDRSFAAGLARCFIDAAPRRDAVAALGEPPTELDCEPEHQAIDDTGSDRGFVDLRFFNESQGFTLLVELKLHSGYGHEQLERYRSTLDPLSGRAALLAMTTWLPRYGEETVAEDPRWLGSARWAHAFGAMRELEHADPLVRQLWPELLDLIREQGDFGVMDIDKTAVQGWAHWKKGRAQLTALLEEIYEPTLDLLRHQLAERAAEPVRDELAAELRFKAKRLVWPWGESLNVQYAIPAHTTERMRIQFVGGHDQLYFTAEARHGDNRVMSGAPDALRAATDKLKGAGFETGHSWGAYWSRPHPATEWLDQTDVAEALMELVKRDVEALVESGIFDALAELPESGPTAIPDDAEDPEL